MADIYCPACRSRVPQARFCSVCGYNFGEPDIPEEDDSPTILLTSDETLMMSDTPMSAQNYQQRQPSYRYMNNPVPQQNTQFQNVPQQNISFQNVPQQNIPIQNIPQQQKVPADYGYVNTNGTSSSTTGTVPQQAPKKLLKYHITTYIGVVLLGMFVLSSFIIALADSSSYIEEKFGGNVTISKFWICMFFVILLGLSVCAVLLLKKKWLSVSAVSLIGVIMVVCVILSFVITGGRTGKTEYGAGTQLSRFLAYRCYGFAMLKTSVLWVASLALIIFGRFFKDNTMSTKGA